MPGEDNAAMVYAKMTTEELHELRAAFFIDTGNTDTPEHRAFGEGRIAIIDAELKKRGETTIDNSVAQLVLDTKGFLVIRSERQLQPGYVIYRCIGTYGYAGININSAIRILGPATPEEANQQDDLLGLPHDPQRPERVYYYKATAE